MSPTSTTTWSELFPAGRDLFYEGDSPDQFAVQLLEAHGFDPRTDPGWWEVIPGDGDMEPFAAYRFHCPVELLDAVYGSDAYPLGS